MEQELTKAQAQWRRRIFVVTWLGYAGFYFCRKNFSVTMPLVAKDLGYTNEDFAIVIGTYSFLYMLGQFLNGYLSDKYGPRLIVGIGLIVAVGANAFMGISGALGVFAFLMGINGLGQSTGWSGLIKNMTTWFRHSERGVVMSWWTTNYVIGAFLATIFATYWATNETILPNLGWKRGFWAPSIVLFLIAIVYILFTRNRPRDVGLPVIVKDEESKIDSKDNIATKFEVLRNLIKNPAIWIAATIYFLLKLTRYAFLFWLPMYMIQALHYADDSAGYVSSVFELAGFLGVIIAGYASDKLFHSKRFPISGIMLFGLAIICFLQPMVSTWGMFANSVSIGIIGIMTFGPDSILSGATAMDIGGKKGSATAAGFINGFGSCGQLVSPFIVAYTSSHYGWNSLFYLFVVFALISGTLTLFKWNYQSVVAS